MRKAGVKVLVTGAAGFIGFQGAALLDRGDEAAGFDNLTSIFWTC
jgi:nucleoside-diphosphate-sugar epimerase